MKILFYLVTSLIFTNFIFSCKTKEVSCDSYSKIKIIQRDTFCIDSQHIHIEEEGLCVYFDDIETVYVDTFYLKIPKKQNETYNYASN